MRIRGLTADLVVFDEPRLVMSETRKLERYVLACSEERLPRIMELPERELPTIELCNHHHEPSQLVVLDSNDKPSRPAPGRRPWAAKKRALRRRRK